MFHFIRKKTFLNDLIPSDYVDIHCHLLPGIDDGAPDIETTSLLTEEIRKLGFAQSIATPHIMTTVWDNTPEIIGKTYNNVIGNLDNQNQDSLRFAAEYLIDPHFVKLFKTKPLLTLKDNYVLVEISYLNPPIQLFDILFELQVAGYQPVLAHPERYPFYHHSLRDYEKLKYSGCLFQLNLLSTVGYYGTGVANAAERLLAKGLIDFVGSDIHHMNHIKAFSDRMLFKDVAPLKEAIQKNQFFKW